MTKGHFHPFQVHIQGPRGPKMAIFYGKIASKDRASSRVRQPTWKVSSAPYHNPMHGGAWLWAILAIFVTLDSIRNSCDVFKGSMILDYDCIWWETNFDKTTCFYHDLNVRLCALYQVHQEILKWVRAHPIYIDLFGHANILKAPSFDWLIINMLASALQCVNVI